MDFDFIETDTKIKYMSVCWRVRGRSHFFASVAVACLSSFKWYGSGVLLATLLG